MRRLGRKELVTVLTVCGVCGVAASTSQAIEGPFFKVSGKRLLAGETREAEAKIASTKYVIAGGGLSIKCTGQKTEKAILLGSTGSNASSEETTLVFEGCAVTGNGEGCAVAGGKIKSERLIDFNEYPKSPPAIGFALTLLLRAAAKNLFSTIKFEGAGCKMIEVALEGTVIGEALNAEKTPIKIGEASESEGTTAFENFPPTRIPTAFIEEEGKFKEVKATMKFFGVAVSTFEGTTEVGLSGKEKWGTFTK
jgi:hypothetical protein